MYQEEVAVETASNARPLSASMSGARRKHQTGVVGWVGRWRSTSPILILETSSSTLHQAKQQEAAPEVPQNDGYICFHSNPVSLSMPVEQRASTSRRSTGTSQLTHAPIRHLCEAQVPVQGHLFPFSTRVPAAGSTVEEDRPHTHRPS